MLAYAFKAIDNNDNGKIDFLVVYPFAVAQVTYAGTKSFTVDYLQESVLFKGSNSSYKFEDVATYSDLAEDDFVVYTPAKYSATGEETFTKVETVLAGDGDVLFVGVEDGFDNVKPQTHPVLVGGAGGVGLVEPVKDMGELLGGDGLALVADGDIGFAGLGGNPESETPLGRGELHGVVQQVVADLGDCVWVAPNHHRAVGELGLHVQILFRNLGL